MLTTACASQFPLPGCVVKLANGTEFSGWPKYSCAAHVATTSPSRTVISASQRRAVERDFAGRETPTATRAMKSQSYPRASASMSTRRDGATDGAASMNGHATHRRRAEPGMTRSDTSCGRQYL